MSIMLEKLESLFEPLPAFDVVVPSGHDPATFLATFREKHERGFYYFHRDITDGNFSRPTVQLTPSRKFKVEVWGIIRGTATSVDCLAFLRSRGSRLVGAQGLSLVYELAKDRLQVGHWPRSRWIVSFDKEEALWKDSAHELRVPRLLCNTNMVKFDLGYFKSTWGRDTCLLCFCNTS